MGTIQTAFEKFLNGTRSLAASFKAAGIPTAYDFVKVLLIAPYSGDQLTGLDRIQPQKGLERIAFYLLRTLPDVDAMVYNPNLLYSPGLFQKPELERLDIIGFGTLDPVFDETIPVILDLHARYPQSLKLLGGIAATHMDAQKIFEALPIDLIVRGPGENPMKEIIQNWQKDGDLVSRFGNIPGLVLSVGEKALPTSLAKNLTYEQYKFVAEADFRDIPLKNEDRLHGKSYWARTTEHLGSENLLQSEVGRRMVRLGTSDFCRRKCVFCSAVAFQKERNGSVARIELAPTDIIKLMKSAKKQYPESDSFHFDDDDFLSNQKRIKDLCRLIIKSGLASWPKSCKSRVDYVDSELLALMKEAGFAFIAYGVESFSERILKQLQKGTRPQQIENALNMTLESGIKPGLNMILFSPFTTPPEVRLDIEKSIEYVKRGAVLLSNPRMEAYHGAPIMERMDWINYKKIYHPGMKAPFYAPTYVSIQDPDTRELFEKALKEKENFIEKLRSYPEYQVKSLPFVVSGLALFYGVYSALGESPSKLAEIEELVLKFLKG